MTELLCLKDSYAKECVARVERVAAQKIVLNQTVFYAQGGGQPFDLGTISKGAEIFKVLSVRKEDGEVFHELEGAHSLAQGDEVSCKIDWQRRYALMRMHTAAHVLAGAVLNGKHGALITGNQLGVEETRFDFNLENFDRELMEKAIVEANEILARSLDVRVSSMPREQALAIPGMVKLANALPPSLATLRIVDIGGVDVQADGGTHVANTREVGAIKLVKLENKGKANRRLYYALSEHTA